MSQFPKILLAEDNPNDIELTLRSLRKHNLADSVFVASAGATALDYVFGTGVFIHRDPQEQPKIIFLNVKLPKLDGVEVLRRLKAHEQTKIIPVVVLTSSREEEEIVKSYQLEVNGYIVKPLEYENLVRAACATGLHQIVLNETQD